MLRVCILSGDINMRSRHKENHHSAMALSLTPQAAVSHFAFVPGAIINRIQVSVMRVMTQAIFLTLSYRMSKRKPTFSLFANQYAPPVLNSQAAQQQPQVSNALSPNPPSQAPTLLQTPQQAHQHIVANNQHGQHHTPPNGMTTAAAHLQLLAHLNVVDGHASLKALSPANSRPPQVLNENFVARGSPGMLRPGEDPGRRSRSPVAHHLLHQLLTKPDREPSPVQAAFYGQKTSEEEWNKDALMHNTTEQHVDCNMCK